MAYGCRKKYIMGEAIIAAGFYFGEEVAGDDRWLMVAAKNI